MTEVVLRNKNLINTLNSFVDEFYSIDGYNDPRFRMHSSQKALDNPEYFCDTEYLRYQQTLGEKHSGFPEEYVSQPISKYVQNDADRAKFEDFKNKVKHGFATEIGAHTSALLNYYPPGGFVGWHTNWNANAYQILFTWSKTGDGYFRYLDNATGEIVTIPDQPGWNVRHYYFGRYDEPEHHCWHAAYAGCDRITLAYKFVNKGKNHPDDAMAQMMRDQLIEEIETE